MATGLRTMQQYADCCENFAAACTSARLCRIVDTAILAVSIIIVWILALVQFLI